MVVFGSFVEYEEEEVKTQHQRRDVWSTKVKDKEQRNVVMFQFRNVATFP